MLIPNFWNAKGVYGISKEKKQANPMKANNILKLYY